jgi:DNA repair protein RadC
MPKRAISGKMQRAPREKQRCEYKLKDLPPGERPRERLMEIGVSALSNAELLAIIIGTGSREENVLGLANRVLVNHSVSELPETSAGQLKSILGISDAKACRIKAAIELGRRAMERGIPKKKIGSPREIAGIYFNRMRALKKEVLSGIYLDSRLNIVKQETIAVGGANANHVYPREIFMPAVREAAVALILVHNHPSGNPRPSGDDIRLTHAVRKAGRVLGIELIDHIIIGNREYVSLKEHKYL